MGLENITILAAFLAGLLSFISPCVLPLIPVYWVTFPIVLDETGDVVKTYRVLGLPTTVFIDRTGVIRELHTGPVTKGYIESKLPEL